MVKNVRYPGFGAVVSFEAGATVEQTESICDAATLIANATSLGESKPRGSAGAGGNVRAIACRRISSVFQWGVNISKTFGTISTPHSPRVKPALFSKWSIFIPMKALRRTLAAITVALLAFRAVGSFLSWVEKQDENETDAWIDEDEFEEA